MRSEIIAEIGINHNGHIELAKSLINIAKDCGADVAKFQLYDPEALLNPKDFGSEDWEIILKTKLSKDQAYTLKKHCDDIGIEFMASAFDLERLGWLEEFGVKRHKIASRSVYDIEYINAVKLTNKEYFVSTGMIDNKKEEEWITWTRLGASNPKVLFLYCVSKYPTSLKDISFHQEIFNNENYYGFSDHTIGLTASIVALSLGAKIIEKHFTLHKFLPGPDQACSMTPSELRKLCKFRDELCEMRGL